MSAEEYAKLNIPAQIVITKQDGQFKVAVMSAERTLSTLYFEHWRIAAEYVRSYAEALIQHG